jgi:hypothetical protein
MATSKTAATQTTTAQTTATEQAAAVLGDMASAVAAAPALDQLCRRDQLGLNPAEYGPSGRRRRAPETPEQREARVRNHRLAHIAKVTGKDASSLSNAEVNEAFELIQAARAKAAAEARRKERMSVAPAAVAGKPALDLDALRGQVGKSVPVVRIRK